MPNSNTYISAQNPVLDPGSTVFSRTWFRFLSLVATRIAMLDGTTSTSATAGDASPLPATPAGYMIINDAQGVARKVPYYNE